MKKQTKQQSKRRARQWWWRQRRRRKKKSRNWPPVPSSTRWLVEPPTDKAGKKGLCRLSRVVTLSLRSCAVCHHCRYDTLLLSPLLQYCVSPQLGGGWWGWEWGGGRRQLSFAHIYPSSVKQQVGIRERNCSVTRFHQSILTTPWHCVLWAGIA